MNEEILKIQKMISEGKISPEEGAKMTTALFQGERSHASTSKPKEENVILASKNLSSTIAITTLAILVFIFAFLSWGEIVCVPKMNVKVDGAGVFSDFGAELNKMQNDFFGGMKIAMTVTGWNGSTSLEGIGLPNWMVVVAAGLISILVWLGCYSILKAPSILLFGLACYGLFHSGLATLLFLSAQGASIGPGSILTLAAFIGMFILLVRRGRIQRMHLAEGNL